MPTDARVRKSAAERRAEIIEVALRHFADRGYHAASTDAMAADAGISQPYLFRLFGTKRDLFLACHAVGHERIRETFRAAADAAPADERMAHMGAAYLDLLRDRHQLLFQMQSYAACADPEIRAVVRGRYGDLVRDVARWTGGDSEEVWRFFANGMLLNVVVALGLEEIAGTDDWAALWCEPAELVGAEEAPAQPGAGAA